MKLKLTVSAETKTVTLNLKDYGMTKYDWDCLSEREQEEALREFVDEQEQPYWDFEIIKR